jgi:hypothetical protein
MRPIDRTYISPPIGETIYIAEYARRNSRRLQWSAMPAFRREVDSLIDSRRVPAQARREARAFMEQRT